MECFSSVPRDEGICDSILPPPHPGAMYTPPTSKHTSAASSTAWDLTIMELEQTLLVGDQ